MTQTTLSENKMYQALLARDASFEGIFFVGVKTTGIFCRPTCRARKPKRQNVEFFFSAKDALVRGYRPCKVCHPMQKRGEAPAWVRAVLEAADASESLRLNDFEIRKRGLDPNRLRRWFKQNHQMTFQAYLRSRRLGRAFGHLAGGRKVIETAMDHGYGSLSGFSEAFKKKMGTSPLASKKQEMVAVDQILTPLGPMLAAATKKGVCLLEFTDRRGLEASLQDLRKRMQAPLLVSPNPLLKQLKAELEEYFSGKRKTFTVPVFPVGTPFQKKVWEILLGIPYGSTRSYKEQARAVGDSKAVRAVARANGQNKIAIVIPCHRVIGSNGHLTGYAGGLERKKYLLALEQKDRG